jgi:hypothetical protein
MVVTREEALSRISELKPELERFDVKSLSLFGSVARNEAVDQSDLDLIVEFNGDSRYDNYFGLLFFLEDRLGVQVDLAEPETLHRLIRERVLEEAVRAA